MLTHRTILHGHLFCGDGGGASGFNAGHVRVGEVEASFECVGGIDADPGACADFERFVGVPATCLDLFDRGQFLDFHAECVEDGADRCRACGNTGAPPPGWREATAADIVRAFGGRRPDIAFTSAPCKGFSGLLAKGRSSTRRYQALNRLTVRGVRLLLDAFEGDPIPLILFENVPLIQSRGRALLDDIVHELELAGYAVAETVHDCGELGGLAQSRRRFLLVARHRERVRPFVYVPPRRPLRGVGEVIGELPVPSAARGGPGGPMHRLSTLTWKTALRLALIPAGKDWRALEGMDFGALRIVPSAGWHADVMGVVPWSAPVGTVTSRGGVTNGAFSTADPRVWGGGALGVRAWDQPAPTIAGESYPSNGAFSIADPRATTSWAGAGKYAITRWTDPARTAISANGTGNGAFAVADVRASGVRHNDVFRVVDWRAAAGCVTAGGSPSAGGQSVADVRVGSKSSRDDFQSSGHYGVTPWDQPAKAVTSHACHDNGQFSVADPRPIPGLDERTDAIIIALDGTWHRPFTTLELAVLQGYDPADLMLTPLTGTSHTDWREHIGNRVPTHAATAIAEVFGETLLRHELGEGWRLDAREVWVRRLIAAVAVPT